MQYTHALVEVHDSAQDDFCSQINTWSGLIWHIVSLLTNSWATTATIASLLTVEQPQQPLHLC